MYYAFSLGIKPQVSKYHFYAGGSHISISSQSAAETTANSLINISPWMTNSPPEGNKFSFLLAFF